MKRIAIACSALAMIAVMVMPAPVVAQQAYVDSASAGPPPVIQVFKEEVKPGKAHCTPKAKPVSSLLTKKPG